MHDSKQFDLTSTSSVSLLFSYLKTSCHIFLVLFPLSSLLSSSHLSSPKCFLCFQSDHPCGNIDVITYCIPHQRILKTSPSPTQQCLHLPEHLLSDHYRWAVSQASFEHLSPCTQATLVFKNALFPLWVGDEFPFTVIHVYLVAKIHKDHSGIQA